MELEAVEDTTSADEKDRIGGHVHTTFINDGGIGDKELLGGTDGAKDGV